MHCFTSFSCADWLSSLQSCYQSRSWMDQTPSMVHKTCFELVWNSKAFLTHRTFMSVCPACSTALCALIRGETREVNPSISESYEPPHTVMTSKPLCFSKVSDRCGDLEPTGRRILCSAQRWADSWSRVTSAKESATAVTGDSSQIPQIFFAFIVHRLQLCSGIQQSQKLNPRN